jgi:hypothetical protein
MKRKDELLRRAFLHDQAAGLLRADNAHRYKIETTIEKLWKIIERIFLNIWLWRLERNMGEYFDRDLSQRIDAIRYLLEDRTDA